jgi:hypothetical protein
MEPRDPKSVFPRGEVRGMGPITWSSEEIVERIKRSREESQERRPSPETGREPQEESRPRPDFAVLKNVVMHIPSDASVDARRFLSQAVDEQARDQGLPENVADLEITRRKTELGISASPRERASDQ